MEGFSFFDKLRSRASMQSVWCGNGNFLLEHSISPTFSGLVLWI
ncbi:hypothetical protein BN1184_BE_02560 [Pantoea ananatis]|nr:hypothetical protein BN1182_BQ_02010 [Pantoea ananatis]CRH34730.1 hypothetical protein BN1183_BQ_00110 [Pantoea ananatis]CRH39275.1 hypothetical protein BN1184_BE_02560 [Pantoea ananatis]